jgi:hypothetical protein
LSQPYFSGFALLFWLLEAIKFATSLLNDLSWLFELRLLLVGSDQAALYIIKIL